MNENYMMNEG